MFTCTSFVCGVCSVFGALPSMGIGAFGYLCLHLREKVTVFNSLSSGVGSISQLHPTTAVLVNPEDDKDRGWYIRYVAVRTVDLIGETNIPFPEKWNFEPTMGDVEPIPNFRGWVDSLLKIATREQRTWKSISSLHGWKVKTHGFGIRGMIAEVAMAIRMSANAALDLDKARALLPKRKATKESSEEEEEGTSLITRPRARRRIIIDNEIENTPARTSATEPVLIQSDEDAEPRDNNESIQHLFDSGFGSGELGPVFDEAPLSSFVPISSIPLPAVSVSLPALTTFVCLPISTAPISVPLAASTAPASAPVLVSTSFTSIPSAAPLPSANLIRTELMRRISLLERKARESEKSVHEAEEIARGAQLEATNWKEQFENAQGTIEELQEDKNLLEQQNLPENVAIPASEGETSTTQSVEVEASVTTPSIE
ncbi:uncharacterized protein LOC142163053 [Nicotiana tabacum]|uniref:Uncharacterized protein LOC142163053 n=1 Tax=Nicotiana tabacum TaxID=4097 RepID=A0AC58RUR2_TOBAC